MTLFFQEAFPHAVALGPSSAGYKVIDGRPLGYRQPPSDCCQAFTLVTPTRKYVLATESTVERDDWMHWLRVVIEGASVGERHSV